MGQMFFGGTVKNGYNLYMHPDVTPHPLEPTTNDPLYGFPKREVRREPQSDEIDYYSAKLIPKHRDYCADELLQYRGCRREYWPFPVFCEHFKHVYLNCVYDDYILRMKEYERERRLLERGFISKNKREVDDTDLEEDKCK